MPAPGSHTVLLSSVADRPDWQFESECYRSNYPPETFFPPKSLGPQGIKKAYNVARRICDKCSYSEACLQWAIEQKISEGMFGGKTPRERRAIARGFSTIKENVPGRDIEGRFIKGNNEQHWDNRKLRGSRVNQYK